MATSKNKSYQFKITDSLVVNSSITDLKKIVIWDNHLFLSPLRRFFFLKLQCQQLFSLLFFLGLRWEIKLKIIFLGNKTDVKSDINSMGATSIYQQIERERCQQNPLENYSGLTWIVLFGFNQLAMKWRVACYWTRLTGGILLCLGNYYSFPRLFKWLGLARQGLWIPE